MKLENATLRTYIQVNTAQCNYAGCPHPQPRPLHETEERNLNILQRQHGQDSTTDNGTDRARETCRPRCCAGELYRTSRGCRLRGNACGLSDNGRWGSGNTTVDGCTIALAGRAGLVFSVRSVRGVGNPIPSRGRLPWASLGEGNATAGGARIDGWGDYSRARRAVSLFAGSV